jgi:hypothetical protein
MENWRDAQLFALHEVVSEYAKSILRTWRIRVKEINARGEYAVFYIYPSYVR